MSDITDKRNQEEVESTKITENKSGNNSKILPETPEIITKESGGNSSKIPPSGGNKTPQQHVKKKKRKRERTLSSSSSSFSSSSESEPTSSEEESRSKRKRKRKRKNKKSNREKRKLFENSDLFQVTLKTEKFAWNLEEKLSRYVNDNCRKYIPDKDIVEHFLGNPQSHNCLLYTSPSPRDS